MDSQPIRKPLIIRIPIRPKKPTPPPNNVNATAQKLRASLLGKLALPLSPSLKSQIDHRLRELAPTFHTPDHPPYALMISKAIEELDDGLGSSVDSISEFIVRGYKDLPMAHRLMLAHYLGKLCEDGVIVRAGGGRYMLPGNDKKEEKAPRRKGKRRRGGWNVGDENRCRVENFEVCVGGVEEEGQREMGKGKIVPRRRRTRAMQVVERVEERTGMGVLAEQSQAMVVYAEGGCGNELSVQVVENGSQAQRQGDHVLTENLETQLTEVSETLQVSNKEAGGDQADLMNLLDWNPVPSTMFQLDNSELVSQAEAEGTSCIELGKEMAEKLRCHHPSPSFSIEVKQFKEEMTKMKQ